MKRLLISLLSMLSLALPLCAATDGKFTYSYPEKDKLPYNLGYQYSTYDLKETPDERWRVMYLTDPVTLTYNITSEKDKTVEVVFDPSYLELLDIVIPEKVIDNDTKTEYTVTAIGKMAFDDCPKIRSVIMSDAITRIEDYAFNMCENKVLHDIGFIRFSENLTHIGNFAFKNCHNLTTGYYIEGNQLKLRPNTALVGSVDYPFYGYAGRRTGLDNYLLLPASVEYIGKHAFEGCYFEREDNHLNYGLCKVKIPNPSCVIDDYAFAGCKFLELVTIGEELTHKGLKNPNPGTAKKGRIGNHAFADCNLMRLDIPSSIESIGENAFSNCFHRVRDLTQRSNDGRIYLDELNWFYPRSLFNNWDGSWHKWNFSEAKDREYKDSQDANTDDLYDFDVEHTLDFLPLYEKYLDVWHTNTVTIHSDKTNIASNAFANNPLLEKIIINGDAGEYGSGAFRNCFNLTEVKLPDDLTKLSNGTFMNDTALVEIKIPKDVTEIGDSTFYHCNKLANVDLPSKLGKINPYTFYGCEQLDLSTLPESVTSIGDYAFYGCQYLKSFNIPNKVTKIGDYAFANCYTHELKRNPEYNFNPSADKMIFISGLTHVKIGGSVTSIGEHAFDGCRHLGQIEFGESVKYIGDYAFQNCMSCPEANCDAVNMEVSLPNSLTAMGTGAFQGCTHIPEITLGEHMTTLPDFAFAYCSDLQSVGNIDNITTANKNAFIGCYSLDNFGSVFQSEDGIILGEDGIFYNLERTEVISALPNISVADLSETKVVKIHDGAFANCGALQEIYFPPTLEEIGSRAFENCTQLTWAELINVKMGEFVYAGCTGIEGVDISEDFTQDLQDNWFAGCIYMQGISVMDGNPRYSSDENYVLLLSKDGKTLLRAPSGISELYIPESVTKIGDYALSNCINLREAIIPESVTHIGAHAFDNCCDLREVEFDNPAVTIGEYAFNNCKNLYLVYWDVDFEPKDVGRIGAYAFNDCESLDSFNSEFKFNISDAVVSTLEPYALANLSYIEKIELPETLETIGDHAFENCENLASVVFPENLKRIGNSAFKSTGLKTIKLPDSIEAIGDSAFMDCSKVMALKLPSGLKKINPFTFYKCFSGAQFDEKPTVDEEPTEDFNLSVVIPDAVESIGDYAFYGCAANFNKYYSPANTYSSIHHFYHYGLSSVSIGESVKTIGKHAFDGCLHLFDVNMGASVNSIGDYAFNNCFNQTFMGVKEAEYTLTGLIAVNPGKPLYTVVWYMNDTIPQPIDLPEGLTKLGVGAFNGCTHLPSINFPASLTTIPAQAFNGCSSIPEIILPEGVRSIGDVAFGGCKGVKKISIPASLKEGSRVFVDCDSALSVTYHAVVPEKFDEAFFSPKVYSSKEAVINAPNTLLEDIKGVTPWALFYKIVAKDETLEHLEKVLEEKNGLRFRVLANKPTPYCEVAGPAKVATEPTSYVVPEFVLNTDPNSEYYGKSYKVIRIGNDAFENDLNLVGIEIPNSVFDIGQEAFNGCKNLPEINLPASINNMGERAFANCYALTYFEVPPLVTRLNPGVLKDCRGLYSIGMHDNIEELCAEALMDCRHLRKFERSENWKLRLIDDYALKNCIELEEINIPEGVEKIGKEAMYYCQKLNTVSLPKSLLQLGENTFDDCEVLTVIKVFTETPPETVGERNLTDQSCKIYVQAKCLDAYKEFWKMHEHRIEPGIEITKLSREDMPEYNPTKFTTYKLQERRPLDGQEMTWTAKNGVVATADKAHDGTININAVGRTNIHVHTDKEFYHDQILDVYPMKADANWDGRFDISDAVNIANYALQNAGALNNWWRNDRKDFDSESLWNHFYYVGADLNNSGDISVSDASAAVKIILNAPAQSSPAAKPSTRASDLELSDALIISLETTRSGGNVSLPIGLDNNIEYVALQADIRVKEGKKLKDVTIGGRAAGHELTTRRIDDRTMRVVIFDLNNSAFTSSAEPLFNVTIEGDNISSEDVELSGIYASDYSSKSFELTSRNGWLRSDVGTVSAADFSVAYTGEGILIGNAAGKKVTISATDGKVVNSFVAASDSETVSLSHGIYIVTVEGRSLKVAVK